MTFDLSRFRDTVTRPARPTLFQVTLDLKPFDGMPQDEFVFLCQASTVPGVSVGAYQIKYQGREIQYAGDLTFDPWKVTVINQEGNEVRESFELWFQGINNFSSGLRSSAAVEATSYKGNATIVQFTQDGNTSAAYRVEGLFPTMLDPLVLDWTQTDQYQTFDVTFAFDWWSVDDVLMTGSDSAPTSTAALAPSP